MTRTRIQTTLLLAAGLCLLMPISASAEDLLCDENGAPSLDCWLCYHEEPIKAMADVWQIKDGVLTCKGVPNGYLYTKKKYTDFVLKLQWRWVPDTEPGRGGVLFRMTGEHKVWPKSLEAQINAGGEGDFVGLIGYELSGPAERSSSMQHDVFGKLTFVKKAKALAKPPGQWNDYEIIAKGGTVTLRLNGQQVNQATNCDVVAGPILLTAEGNPIQFRKIELTSTD